MRFKAYSLKQVGTFTNTKLIKAALTEADARKALDTQDQGYVIDDLKREIVYRKGDWKA